MRAEEKIDMTFRQERTSEISKWAKLHAEVDDPDHEVGDLQETLQDALSRLSDRDFYAVYRAAQDRAWEVLDGTSLAIDMPPPHLPETGYLVTWTIDADGADPVEAAREALDAQTDRNTFATFFEVLDKATGKKFVVDLTDRSTTES